MAINGSDGPKGPVSRRHFITTLHGRNMCTPSIFGERYLLYRGERPIEACFNKLPDFCSVTNILAGWGVYGVKAQKQLRDQFDTLLPMVKDFPDLGFVALQEKKNGMTQAISLVFAAGGSVNGNGRIVLAALPAPWNLPENMIGEIDGQISRQNRVDHVEVACLIYACRSFLQTGPKMGDKNTVSFVMGYVPRNGNDQAMDVPTALKLIPPAEILRVLQAPFFRNEGLPQELQELSDKLGLPYFSAEAELGKLGNYRYGETLEKEHEMWGIALGTQDAMLFANRYAVFIESLIPPEPRGTLC